MRDEWKIPSVFILINKMMCLGPFRSKGMKPGIILNYIAFKMAEPNHKNICHPS